ncbi:LuxR C-terminal-related transcriptional regulator [Chryseolinea soli]|nr:LuxR C-terminal-related transcriptional regulator [Chryseolinea soli]
MEPKVKDEKLSAEIGQYKKLHDIISATSEIPEDFIRPSTEDDKYCYYMFSTARCSFLFIDKHYESFMGYLPEEHKKGGLDFWFSKVHPDDRKLLADRILEFQGQARSSHSKEQPLSAMLNYRFRKGTGEWIWLQHTVLVAALDESGMIDKLVHRLRMLEALSTPVHPEKKPFEVALKKSDSVGRLTNREKQVLKLVAEGFSSKIIADQLSISINTVETHRRHLLEKLNAKNSMELVKRAFSLFWN